MITTQETHSTALAMVQTATQSEETNAEAFAQALAGSLTAADIAGVNDLMAGLTSGLGDAVISTRPVGGTTSSMSATVWVSTNLTINVSSDMVNQLATDGDLFSNVRDLLSELLYASGNQALLDTGGTDITRTINIEAGEVRYVEVQHDTRGAQLSVSQLALAARQAVGDSVLALLDSLSGNTDTAKSISDNYAWFTKSSGFGSLLTSSDWRFSSYMTVQTWMSVVGTATSGTQTTMQSAMLAATQSSGKIDLVTYLREMGLFDPLVLDLGDEGFNLSSAEDGVWFDLAGDGSPVQTGFIRGSTALLYMDTNGNGTADDISELFGDHGGHADGWANLAQHDDNGDGVIDAQDAVYSRLRVWQDADGDGVCAAGETQSLADAGVASINLRHGTGARMDAGGNVIANEGTFTRTNGSSGRIADAWLRAL